MPDKKISELVNLTSLATDDEFVVVDKGANATKRITATNLSKFPSGVTVPDAGTIGSASDPDAMAISSGGVVTFSQGLSFGADMLDDYEEGTWTPIYVPQTGSFTTMTYSVNTGLYQKIGNFVHAQFYIATSNVNTTGASGNLVIEDLPYASSAAVGIAFFASRWNGDVVKFIEAASTGQLVLWASNSDDFTRTQVSGLTTGAAGFQNIINGFVQYEVL